MSLRNLQGRVAWIFEEDDFDIDLIVGVRNIKITDLNELVAVTMTDYDPGFAAAVMKGRSARRRQELRLRHPHYPAMRAMRHLGITGVIAESFSPGFFRARSAWASRWRPVRASAPRSRVG